MAAVLSDWAQGTFEHAFADQDRLLEAVTHPSLAGRPSYQRLEFLGDRVLGLVIADQLLKRFPDENEGTIARRFVKLVRKEALAAVAREIDVPRHIQLENAARHAGIHRQDSVCADVMEALIGALYLDAGIDAVKRFISAHWAKLMAADTGARRDPKTRLQEWAQGRGLGLPVYEITARTGPDHDPVFDVSVTVEGHGEATARAGSKREAEKLAAQALCHQIGITVK